MDVNKEFMDLELKKIEAQVEAKKINSSLVGSGDTVDLYQFNDLSSFGEEKDEIKQRREDLFRAKQVEIAEKLQQHLASILDSENISPTESQVVLNLTQSLHTNLALTDNITYLCNHSST